MQIVHEAESFCVAQFGPLAVVVWGRVVEGPDLARLGVVQRKAIKEFGHCVVLSIIRAGLEMTVNEDVRAGGRQNLREFEHVTLGSALVIEAGGMRASFFRSVITGIHLLARSKVPQKVLDNIDEGVRWLVERPGLAPEFPPQIDAIIAGAHKLANQFGAPTASNSSGHSN